MATVRLTAADFRVHRYREADRARRLLGVLVWTVPRLRAGLREVIAGPPDVVHAKVNTESSSNWPPPCRSRSIPTIMAFRDGVLLFAQPGALPAPALEELVGKIKELDMDAVRAEIAAPGPGHQRIIGPTRRETNHVLPSSVPPLSQDHLGRLRSARRTGHGLGAHRAEVHLQHPALTPAPRLRTDHVSAPGIAIWAHCQRRGSSGTGFARGDRTAESHQG